MARKDENLPVAFTYGEVTVQYNANRLVNLTQMWEAAGRPVGKEVSAWRRRDDATSFIADLASSLNLRQSHVLTSMRGKGGATWGHRQIALAYAKHLSNEFHRFVNDAFLEWAEEKANPDLKAERAIEGYRRKGWDDGRILARLEGKVYRTKLTETLRDHGVEGQGYAICTDAINQEVLGGTAREIKMMRGLPAKAKTRDHLDSLELAALRFAEAMADRKVKDDCAHGNAQCCTACRKAGRATHQAMASMGLVSV